MNFTLKQKFDLAVVGIVIQLIMLLSHNLIPRFMYSMGDITITIYRVLDIFSVVSLLPFFITAFKNKNSIFAAADSTEITKPQTGSTSLLKHIATRIGIIIVLLALTYYIILGGKGDSMGLGLIFAGLATAAIVFFGLIIDAVIIFRKEKDSPRFYFNILIISALFIGTISFLNMN